MSRLIALSFLVIAACSHSKTDNTSTKPQPMSSTGDDQKLCVEAFTHNRTCTAEYIPALVDTRAKLDIPKGMTEKVKQDRAGVIAKANEEWAQDSTDENIASHCQQMTAHMTEEARALGSEVRACLPETNCTAYVACIEKVEEKLIAHGGAPRE